MKYSLEVTSKLGLSVIDTRKLIMSVLLIVSAFFLSSSQTSHADSDVKVTGLDKLENLM